MSRGDVVITTSSPSAYVAQLGTGELVAYGTKAEAERVQRKIELTTDHHCVIVMVPHHDHLEW